MNRANDVNAFVIHQRQYRETSSIVEFFTERGLLSAVCKGVYGAGKSAARLRGTLQPFGEVTLCWVGRGELKTVRSVETLGAAPALRHHVLYAGLYLNELLLRLAPNNEHDGQYRLYSAYKASLRALGQIGQVDEQRPVGVEACLRTFEMQLLEQTGFAVDFYYEWAGHQPIQAELQYSFDPGRGFATIAAQAEHDFSQPHIAEHSIAEERTMLKQPALQRALQPQEIQQRAVQPGDTQPIPGWAIVSMREGDYRDQRVRRYAKQLTRKALALQLGERPLQTRELYS